MDAVAAATLAFAGIGAVGTIHGIVDGVLRRRAERRRDIEALEANWTLHARPAPAAGHTLLSLTCNDAIGSPIRLISIEAMLPRGAHLCEGRLVQGEGPPVVVPANDRWASRLDLDRNLYGSIDWGDDQERGPRWSIIHLLARLPLPPTARRDRFRLAVVVEERTAARRRRHIQVASQEVNLPADGAEG